MTPHAMPLAPAPTPVLSRTTMRAAPPALPTVVPLAASRSARCNAVESPWMPAPTITQRAAAGRAGMAGWEAARIRDDGQRRAGAPLWMRRAMVRRRRGDDVG